jgi:hypothetical protein
VGVDLWCHFICLREQIIQEGTMANKTLKVLLCKRRIQILIFSVGSAIESPQRSKLTFLIWIGYGSLRMTNSRSVDAVLLFIHLSSSSSIPYTLQLQLTVTVTSNLCGLRVFNDLLDLPSSANSEVQLRLLSASIKLRSVISVVAEEHVSNNLGSL